MQILSYDDDFLPSFSFESSNQHHRRHRRASSCCGVPISPHLRIDGLSRKSFSYDKLPQQPLKLTIRKLDGSSFDVEIAKKATVAELKQAVEGVFSHMPWKGPGKISWSHVWGHFCLCYDGWKLLADSESICNYGIIDGDQLYFARHLSINENLTRKRSKDSMFAFDQPRKTNGHSHSEQTGERDGSSEDQGRSQQHYDDGNEDIMRPYEFKFAQILGRWFSYRRLESPRRTPESSSFSSRLAGGFLGSFRNIVRLCSGNKRNSRRDPLEEV